MNFERSCVPSCQIQHWPKCWRKTSPCDSLRLPKCLPLVGLQSCRKMMNNADIIYQVGIIEIRVDSSPTSIIINNGRSIMLIPAELWRSVLRTHISPWRNRGHLTISSLVPERQGNASPVSKLQQGFLRSFGLEVLVGTMASCESLMAHLGSGFLNRLGATAMFGLPFTQNKNRLTGLTLLSGRTDLWEPWSQRMLVATKLLRSCSSSRWLSGLEVANAFLTTLGCFPSHLTLARPHDPPNTPQHARFNICLPDKTNVRPKKNKNGPNIRVQWALFFPKQLWSWMGFSILPRNRLCSIIISCFRLGFPGLSPYSFGILFHHHFLVPARVPGLVSLLFWHPVPSSSPGSG